MARTLPSFLLISCILVGDCSHSAFLSPSGARRLNSVHVRASRAAKRAQQQHANTKHVPSGGRRRWSAERATTFRRMADGGEDKSPDSDAARGIVGATQIDLVWLTGSGDLRTHDHGGFRGAAAASASSSAEGGGPILPVFILDPTMHLRSKHPSCLRRLHASLTSLSDQLGDSLVVRSGSAEAVLPEMVSELTAASGKDATGEGRVRVRVHVVEDDVVDTNRRVQRATVSKLDGMEGVELVRWENCLRSGDGVPWTTAAAGGGGVADLPSDFTAYCGVVDTIDALPPAPFDAAAVTSLASETRSPLSLSAPSEGVPTLEEMIRLSRTHTPPPVLSLRKREFSHTTEPYDGTVASRGWCDEIRAREALREYCQEGGRDAFADRHFLCALEGSPDGERSLHAVAAQRLKGGDSSGSGGGGNRHAPSAVLALREAPTRAFSPALTLGALSPREVLDAARTSSPSKLLPSDNPLWGRSSEGALADVVEWREWFRLLASRSLARYEEGMKGWTSGTAKEIGGDPREHGEPNYWRWKGQHLVRYLRWDAGEGWDGQTPAMLLVHGFAASSEQWERLVHSLKVQSTERDGLDATPPIFAMDLLGFGHSEKPGLSYTQYVWESQIVDFCLEVMEGQPVVLGGNSIGGGLSAGAASSLGPLCRGVVLCNTAGVLEDPGEYNLRYEVDTLTLTRRTLEGDHPQEYSPVPLFGRNSLDLFGDVIIRAIYPQIDKRLADIYANNPSNADPALVYAIQQGASSPGSANVIGSGQKLAANRPLNEVLCPPFGFGGPVLVAQGMDDRVSTPQVAKKRAELFGRLRDGVTVRELEEGGHCPQDEVPDLVAEAVLDWLPEVRAFVPLEL